MNSRPNELLLLGGKTITLLIQGAVALGGIAVALVFAAVALSHDRIDMEISAQYGGDIAGMPLPAVLALLALALGILVLIYEFFGKLRGIIATVEQGEPFVHENADRLNAMGWLQIGIYLVGIPLVAAGTRVKEWASQFDDVEIAANFDFDPGSILLILVLFILSQVFRHGAAMREDLEGTV